VSKERRYSDWLKKDADIYWNKITEAVMNTAEKVLTYEGKLVMDPFYFSMSSGKTENAVDVFAYDRPYLRSVESSGEKSVRDFETTAVYTYDKLASLINTKYPKSNVSSKKLKSQLSIRDRTSGGGSVKSMKVGGVTLTGRQFREFLELKSSNFKIVFNSKNIQVVSMGYGHGVGMSQWGARIMAKEGSNYEEILTHYYLGVKIDKLENIK
jgi:stage II sporulation protein D